MPLKEIPDRYLGMIIHFLMNFHNETSEFSRPHIRMSFHSTYMLFVVMYAFLVIAGVIANIYMLRNIIMHRQQWVRAHKYLACNALNDMLKSAVVLPISLSTTLLQNWIYGNFLCHFFPMLQDVPFHATMLTFLLIVFDRYREILYPIKPRIPSCLCIVSVWVASVFAVLPYAVYTRYLNLEEYLGAQFKGTGICAVNVENNIEEYIRGLFIVMYVLPLGLIAFLHVKASEEIKTRQSAYTVVFHETAANRRETDSPTSLTPCVAAGTSGANDDSRKPSSVTLSVPTNVLSARSSTDERTSQEITLRLSTASDGDDHDWILEKKIQSFLVNVISVYAACLLPLNLVRLLKHVTYETYENSYHFDYTFIAVVWIAFIPTVATPILYKTSHISGTRPADISRYLRLGRASDVSFSTCDSQKRNSAPRKYGSDESSRRTDSLVP